MAPSPASAPKPPLLDMLQAISGMVIAAGMIGLVTGVIGLREGQAEIKGILSTHNKIDAFQTDSIKVLGERIYKLEVK